MAQLNIRERVIETTIAYVGATAPVGAINFAHVKRDVQRGRVGNVRESTSGDGRILELDWRPREGGSLNDCEISVKLVATDGRVAEASMQELLVDADGLVLVLEADDTVDDGNRRAVETVREALAHAQNKKVPVVVQVNGTSAAGVEALVADEWPRVNACAEKGEGVMETLQRAVDVVVETMQHSSGVEGAAPRPRTAVKAEGNPLLAALRQLLQSALADQRAELETHLIEHFEKRLTARDDAIQVVTERLGRLDAWMVRIEASVLALSGAPRDEDARPADIERLAAVVTESRAVAKELATLVDEVRSKKKSWFT